MKKFLYIIYVLLIGGSLLFAAPATADDDLDLLKDLDKEISKEKSTDPLKDIDKAATREEVKKDGISDQLAAHLAGSFRLRAMYFFRNPEERDDADMNNVMGEALLKFSDWVGGEKWRVDVSGWGEAGTQKDTYAGVFYSMQDDDRRRKYIEVNEIYFTLNQADYNVTLGRKIFANGLSTIYSPSDRLRPRDGNDPLDQKELGIWQARLDYFLNQATITAAVLPVFQANKGPSDTSRWMGSKKDNDNRDFDFHDTSGNQIEEDRANIAAKNIGYFARYKNTYKGWDLFFSFYHGPNLYYVLREEDRGGTRVKIKESVKVGNYAAGFSTTYKKWEFHGEALLNYSYDGKDDQYVSGLGGATYTIDDLAKKVGLEQIDVTVEYGGEFILKAQYAEGYVQSSRKTRLGRNDIYGRVNFKYSEDLSFEYVANFELSASEGGYYQKIQSKYRLRDGLIWKAALEFFNGDDNSYYGRWYRNDRVVMELEYSF
jgi:sulfur carrier protein ThiS